MYSEDFFEVIETDNEIEFIFNSRKAAQPKFSDFGPPDLAYITLTTSKNILFFTNTKQISYYHLVYGVNTSSAASVSAYLSSVLKIHDKEHKSGGKTTKAMYTLYDAFNHIDITVEIHFPGSIKVYGFNEDQQKMAVDETIWSCAHISSILRFMKLKDYPFCRILWPFGNRDEDHEFFELVSKRISDGTIPKNMRHSVFEIISKWIVRKQRISYGIMYFKKLTLSDETLVIYLSRIYNSCKRFDESAKLLSKSLIAMPEYLPFLIHQIKTLIHLEKYEISLVLIEFGLQIKYNEFELWIKRIECLVALKRFEDALLILNVVEIKDEAKPFKWPSPSLAYPEVTKKGVAVEYHRKPKNFDFTSLHGTRLKRDSYVERSRNLQNQLERLPFMSLNKKEKILYKLLISIANELTWAKLMTLKVILFEEKTQKENLSTLIKETERTIMPTAKMESEIPLEKEDKKKKDGEENESDEEEVQLPSFLQQNEEENDDDDQRIDTIYISPRPATEKKSKLLAEASSLAQLKLRKKSLSPLVSLLLSSLYQDLNVLYEWQLEEKETEHDENKKEYSEVKLTGEVWILRGYLAERLGKLRMAELAYKRSLEIGYSLYSWFHLTNMYFDYGNYKASLVCIVEVLNELSNDEEDLESIVPIWLEEQLYKIIAEIGKTKIMTLLSELSIPNDHIIYDLAIEAENWGVGNLVHS